MTVDHWVIHGRKTNAPTGFQVTGVTTEEGGVLTLSFQVTSTSTLLGSPLRQPVAGHET